MQNLIMGAYILRVEEKREVESIHMMDVFDLGKFVLVQLDLVVLN